MSNKYHSDAPQDFQLWDLPDMGDPNPISRPAPPPEPAEEEMEDEKALLTADQIEAIQQQAYDEAYEQGKKEGFEFGHREALEEGRRKIEEEQAALTAKIQQLDELLHALNTPFDELDNQVEEELLSLSIALTKQLVRREIKSEPGEVIAVVREALGILPSAARDIRVHLHPEDAQLVREAFAMGNEGERAWKIVDDPIINRGGAKVLSDTSQIDATLENRLNALIADVFGGERVADESNGD